MLYSYNAERCNKCLCCNLALLPKFDAHITIGIIGFIIILVYNSFNTKVGGIFESSVRDGGGGLVKLHLFTYSLGLCYKLKNIHYSGRNP